ncbi:NADH dehydrogenase (ubiquinone) 1 beta subcomplex, 2, 8kDa [Nomia melanderi]|uniref:NADH dehydrogenase (ubiquinone) 1 beta subcomplex, 2, 8kDa n=1 Tax=Nomia melanderi TaxID=2448451 RepID=UPI0013044314|nr:NADH dehydrogenase [ubiquinone] 1 beta subcomplex subunit 2, mitochondrial-like [Nomia melanderi]
MLISRGIHILKTARFLNTKKHVATNLNQFRNSYVYRGNFEPPALNVVVMTEVVGGMFYWWVLWNLWHDWRSVVFGHISIPDVNEFKDESLGLPPEE